MINIKKMFFDDYKSQIVKPEILVIVIEKDDLTKELIINHGADVIFNKMSYYDNAYNDNLELKNNNQIKILSWLFA
jgi:hypothetical protein